MNTGNDHKGWLADNPQEKDFFFQLSFEEYDFYHPQSGRPPVTMTKSRLPVNQTVAFLLALNNFLIRSRMDGTVETLVLKTTTETNMRTSAGVVDFLIFANY